MPLFEDKNMKLSKTEAIIHSIITIAILIIGILLLELGLNNSFFIENEIIRGFFNVITELGTKEYFVIAITLIMYAVDKEYGKFLFCGMMVSTSFNSVIKGVIKDPRPNSNIFNGEPQSDGYGFPSGHAQSSVGLYGNITYYTKHKQHSEIFKRIIMGILILLMILIPISRIALGMHDLEDVIGGVVIGLALLEIYYIIYPKFSKFYPLSLLRKIFISSFIILTLWLLGVYIIGFEEGKYLGMEAGLLLSYIIFGNLESIHINYDPKQLTLKNKIIALILGAGLGFGSVKGTSDIDELFPETEWGQLIGYLLRYFLFGLLVFLVIPWILKKTLQNSQRKKQINSVLIEENTEND